MPNITTNHAITYTNTKDRNIDYTRSHDWHKDDAFLISQKKILKKLKTKTTKSAIHPYAQIKK